jgi:hypothetical protein
MSSYRACAITGRVIIIHDMADRTVISELDLDQACIFLRQLQTALHSQIAAAASDPVISAPAR